MDNFDNLTDDEDFLELVAHVLHPRNERNFRQRSDQFEIWNDKEFKERFRLSKPIVRFIIEDISPQISNRTNRNHGLSPSEMVFLTLRFLATGSFLQVVGDFIGIDQSTASRTIYKVLVSICSLRPQFIKMAETADELRLVKRGFYSIARFPNCIGALDCTHVKIQSPGGDEAELFRNRKQYFSYNVQAVCDSSLKFVDIVCRWPGSAHDSNIFRNSRLRARLENNDFPNCVIVGDSGYAIQKYLITPLHNPQTAIENLFNQSQIRTRNPIERCFGVWKRRFPILALGIRVEHIKVEAIVVAAAVLHNIAIQMGDENDLFERNEEVEAQINFSMDVNVNIQEAHRNADVNNMVRFKLIEDYFPLLN